MDGWKGGGRGGEEGEGVGVRMSGEREREGGVSGRGREGGEKWSGVREVGEGRGDGGGGRE